MNLERVEELCLNYLAQSSNPLVPIRTLFEHCQRDPECAGMLESDLTRFLKAHDQLFVIDRPNDNPISLDLLKDSGVSPGPRVLHKLRMPSREQITASLQEHLQKMIDALTAALDVAQRDEGNPEAIRQLKEAKSKADALKQKVDGIG